MTDVILMGCLIAISYFEIIIYYDFVQGILLEKLCLTKREIVVMIFNIVILGTMLGISREKIFFSHIVWFAGILLTFVCTYLIVKKQLLLVLGCILTYFSVVALSDFIFAYVSIVFLKNDFGKILYCGGVSVEKNLVYVCSRILLLSYCMTLKRIEIKTIERLQNWILKLGIILTILVGYYQNNIVSIIDGTIRLDGKKSLILVLIIFIIIIAVSLIFLKYKILEKENEFLISKEETERQKYKEQEALIEKNKELIHDVKNHFLIIRDYEIAGEYEKLHKYVEEIIEEFIEINPHIYTGNRTIDFILNQKKMLAEKEGIKFELETNIVGEIALQEKEICSLFGNLLDNALEASRKEELNEKIIKVMIERKKQMIFLEISNQTEETPIIENNKFVTTKKNKSMHGYGLKNIQRIVDKYDGIITYETEKGLFVVSLTFYNV